MALRCIQVALTSEYAITVPVVKYTNARNAFLYPAVADSPPATQHEFKQLTGGARSREWDEIYISDP